MGENALGILVVVCCAWVAWSLLRGKYSFEIRIVGGKPRVYRGKVTAAFLSRIAETCAESGVDRGWIGGVSQGRRTALHFSRHFPSGCQQQLRNQWQAPG